MSNISTAMEIQQACTSSVYNSDNMKIVAQIAHVTDFNPEISMLLLKYAASLSADVATRVTSILMPYDQLNSMVAELQEMESLDVN
jgi:hypothetical protein